jgi:DNA-binding MarR family transcriptional regulator
MHSLLVLLEDSPLTPSDIAKRTSTTPATVTGVMDRLVRDGWVTRLPQGKDRRKTPLSPTLKAYQFFTPAL